MLDFSHKARVFKDETLQTSLNTNGFVIVDFLNNEEINTLLDLYQSKHPNGVTGFYTSTFATDKEYRKEVDQLIQSQMLRGINHYFDNYKIHCGSFIVKGTDEKSQLKMHQDMTLVDESIYTGINIWIPLIDLTTENGAIEILPNSHRLFQTYRGATIPDIYDGIEIEVHKLMQPKYLKAGQAVIFDQSIIHYSPANKSDKTRPVINTFITHKDAEIQIYYWDKNERCEIEVFHQAPDFMTNFDNFGHDIFSRPKIGNSAGFVKYDFPKITRELLQKEYGTLTEQKPKRKNFFQRLFN
ncbi:MAG: phytanoyl-CoA dioxygenase family protein [Bacteroidetes bacterium]|nr:phytanoyl-CoA dioxygenase family protein [Bacteroidota bacterium]